MSQSDIEGLRAVTLGIGIALCGLAVANLLGSAVPDLVPTIVLGLLGFATLVYSESLITPREYDDKHTDD